MAALSLGWDMAVFSGGLMLTGSFAVPVVGAGCLAGEGAQEVVK
ncbi:hypothetical protein [Leisingera aquaemixtae]|nr:hypothetical protein [Leisingera aquaemixtae]